MAPLESVRITDSSVIIRAAAGASGEAELVTPLELVGAERQLPLRRPGDRRRALPDGRGGYLR